MDIENQWSCSIFPDIMQGNFSVTIKQQRQKDQMVRNKFMKKKVIYIKITLNYL